MQTYVRESARETIMPWFSQQPRNSNMAWLTVFSLTFDGFRTYEFDCPQLYNGTLSHYYDSLCIVQCFLYTYTSSCPFKCHGFSSSILFKF